MYSDKYEKLRIKWGKMSHRASDGVAIASATEELHGLSLSSLNLNIQADADGDSSSGRSSPILPVFPSELQGMDVADTTSGSETESDEEPPPPKEMPVPTTVPQGNKTKSRTGEAGSSEDPLWDTDEEDKSPPSQPSQPTLPVELQTARNGFRSTQDRIMQQLYRIERRFLDPEELKDGVEDPDWMLNGSNSSGYAKVLMGMIEDLRLLAIKTTLVYESMKPSSNRVRSKLADIVSKMSKVAELHSKLKRPGGGRNMNAMKDVQQEITRLRKLIRAYKTLPGDKAKVLELLEEQLVELHGAIESYIEDKMKNEALPMWIIRMNMRGRPTVEEEIERAKWVAQKQLRVRQAQNEALETYTSFKELKSEVERARRRVNPRESSDDGPPGKRPKTEVFSIDSDSEEEAEAEPPAAPPQLAQEAELIASRHLMVIADSSPFATALKAIIYLSNNPGTFDREAWSAITAALNFGYRYDYHPYNEDAISYREARDVRAMFEFIKKAVSALTKEDEVAKRWFAKNQYGVTLDVLNELAIERKDLEEENADKFEEGTEDEYQHKRILQASKNVMNLADDDEFDMAKLAWARLGFGLQYMIGLYVKDKKPAAGRTIAFVTKVARQLSRVNLKVAQWFENNNTIFEETDELLEIVQKDVLEQAEAYMSSMLSRLSSDDQQLAAQALQSVINVFSSSETFRSGDFMILEASYNNLKSRPLYNRPLQSDIDYILRFLERAVRLSWKRKLKSETGGGDVGAPVAEEAAEIPEEIVYESDFESDSE